MLGLFLDSYIGWPRIIIRVKMWWEAKGTNELQWCGCCIMKNKHDNIDVEGWMTCYSIFCSTDYCGKWSAPLIVAFMTRPLVAGSWPHAIDQNEMVNNIVVFWCTCGLWHKAVTVDLQTMEHYLLNYTILSSDGSSDLRTVILNSAKRPSQAASAANSIAPFTEVQNVVWLAQTSKNWGYVLVLCHCPSRQLCICWLCPFRSNYDPLSLFL